jgi:hypothetical protein
MPEAAVDEAGELALGLVGEIVPGLRLSASAAAPAAAFDRAVRLDRAGLPLSAGYLSSVMSAINAKNSAGAISSVLAMFLSIIRSKNSRALISTSDALARLALSYHGCSSRKLSSASCASSLVCFWPGFGSPAGFSSPISFSAALPASRSPVSMAASMSAEVGFRLSKARFSAPSKWVVARRDPS